MRAFVAIEIPNVEVMDAIVTFQRELAGTRADIKLVERENLHFTVKFLGEITEAQATEADARLRAIKPAGATVSVKGVGAFPNSGRPNVVWVGVGQDDSQRVAVIVAPIMKSLSGIGEEENRQFQPHLTVARVRSGTNRQSLEELIRASSDRSFGTARISEFKLKSSVLTPKGPIYSDVGVYPLS